MTAIEWRRKLPIEKAINKDDGMYIIGLATGPEIDAEGERIHWTCIERFAKQIEEAVAEGTPIPYRDIHLKDGLFKDLGEVTKAWVTDEFELGIEVKLEEDNPASAWLFKSIDKGKKYGMSVAGKVHDYRDERESNRLVRTYYNVTLEEVSNTTRPAYTPSFGTVLKKAIDTSVVSGESMSKETPAAAPTTPETELKTSLEEAKPQNQENPSAVAAPEAPAVEGTTVEQPAPESAEKSVTDRLAALEEKLEKAITALAAASASPAPVESTPAVEKTANESLVEIVTTLAKAQAETQATVARIAEVTSSGGRPPVLQKTSDDEMAEVMKSLRDPNVDPSIRLRAGLEFMRRDDSNIPR